MKNKKAEHLLNKLTVLTHYGNGKCACVRCGYSDIRALSIDHINGDGYLKRKDEKPNIYKYLINQMFPSGYQTLCFNCQHIKNFEEDLFRRKDNEIRDLSIAEKTRLWISARNKPFKVIELTKTFNWYGNDYKSSYQEIMRLYHEKIIRPTVYGMWEKRK